MIAAPRKIPVPVQYVPTVKYGPGISLFQRFLWLGAWVELWILSEGGKGGRKGRVWYGILGM